MIQEKYKIEEVEGGVKVTRLSDNKTLFKSKEDGLGSLVWALLLALEEASNEGQFNNN